jgi:hypothetical protein
MLGSSESKYALKAKDACAMSADPPSCLRYFDEAPARAAHLRETMRRCDWTELEQNDEVLDSLGPLRWLGRKMFWLLFYLPIGFVDGGLRAVLPILDRKYAGQGFTDLTIIGAGDKVETQLPQPSGQATVSECHRDGWHISRFGPLTSMGGCESQCTLEA